MTLLTRLRRLSRREIRLLAASMLLLPATAAALRLVGFGRLHALTSARPARRRHGAEEDDRVRDTARMVAAAARHAPVGGTCLPHSLVLQWLLRRQGIATRLQLGVRKDQGVVGAHAWVEYHGKPLNDLPDVHERFAAFDSAGRAPRTAPRGTR